MLRLRTFGGLSVERDDSEAALSGAATARRRLALLAVLAVAGDRGIRRDKLVALFWPESDDERARHALVQTVYALKQDLGVDGDGLVIGREELKLNPAALTSDVGDFLRALGRGDPGCAATLYTGPFLDGVFLSGAPDFERWVEEERARLARAAEDALEAVASQASARGDHSASAREWQRLAAMDPRKTRVVVALMTELAASGDRASALRQARIYETLVRDELGAEPSPVVKALVERLKQESTAVLPGPEAGPPRTSSPPTSPAPRTTVARSHADNGTENHDGVAAPVWDDAPPPPSPLPPPSLPSRPRWTWLAATAALVAAVAAVALLYPPHRVPFDRREWVLIAAFDNATGDPIFDRSIDALLSAGLQQSTYVNVFPRARVRETLARMMRTDSTARLDEGLAREVAQREGIRAVVAGNVDRVDSTYLITARIVDPASGNALATEAVRAQGKASVIGTLDDLVRALRRDLGESFASITRRHLALPRATTRSLDALRKYADGQDLWDVGRHDEAMDLWRGAVAMDSNFALAHAALGGGYYWANDRPHGDAHFDRALRLLGRLTDRERLDVQAQVESWRGNREAAIQILRTLLTQYPDDRSAWARIGYNYMRMHREGEALEAYRHQVAIDSTNPTDYINVAAAYTGLGQYEAALANYRRAFALQPSLITQDNITHEYGTALVLAGRVDEARQTYQKTLYGSAVQQARGHRSLALLEMYDGRYAEAISHLRDAVLLTQAAGQPLSEARNRLFLAAALRQKAMVAQHRAELDAIYALFRQSYLEPTFLMFAGKHYATSGQVARAAEILDTLNRRAKAGNPSDRAAQEVLAGEVALAQGNAAAAVNSFRAAFTLDSSSLVLESLARGLAATGDVEGALRRYASFGTVQNWLGWEAQEFGLLANYRMGQLYERTADRERAIQAYERFLSRWHDADSDIVAVRDAKKRLDLLRRGAG